MQGIGMAAAMAVLGVLPAQAATCLLMVGGATVIDGPCRFEPIDEEGSFTVTSPDGGFFVYLLVASPGVAEGYWNEERGAGHAHSPLGTLRRDEACWSNAEATVCAW